MWLATLDNEEDLVEARKTIVLARLNDGDIDYTTQTWIGLKAEEVTRSGPKYFKWVEDGAEVEWTNWAPDEPSNNWRNLQGWSENCVEMSLEGTWNDQLCSCDDFDGPIGDPRALFGNGW